MQCLTISTTTDSGNDDRGDRNNAVNPATLIDSIEWPGGYSLRTTNVNPYLSPGQDISFQILVRNDPLSGNQYDIDCIVNWMM